MPVREGSLQENRPLRLVLIDNDPAFRLGLRLWLDQFPDLDIVAETGDGVVALQTLQTLLRDAQTSPLETVDLVILDVSLGRSNPTEIQGLNLCQHIKRQYPTLPVLLLSNLSEPVILAAAQRLGANGSCLKGIGATELVTVIRQVASGQSQWVQAVAETAVSAPVPSPPEPRLPGPFAIARRNLRKSGVRKIEFALTDLTAQLQNLDLSLLDRAVLAGRRRELLASRWLVKRLLATPKLPERQIQTPNSTADPNRSSTLSAAPSPSDAAGQLLVTSSIAARGNAKSIQAVLFDAVVPKLQSSLQNFTETPLEIDILREEKKRELFYLILRKLDELLDELRYSQVQLNRLLEKRSPILQDLWQAVVVDFFGKYYTLSLGNLEVEMVTVFRQDAEIVQTEILEKIPFTTDLLSHLLFQTPLVVDGIPYPPGNPEALARAEVLLENWLIQTANAVVQPLLNRFADVEAIKQSFYHRQLMSSRDIERFRNSLSWRYRLEKYVGEPRDIFESQYRLLTFQGRGIQTVSLYAHRKAELERLSGIPLVVTLALETRDAIAPRLRSAISLVGSGVIFVLTEVVGRGIGLVSRGILKGIGGAWQDSRFNRNGERQK